MSLNRLKKTVGVIALGGFLWGQVNCLPSHNQLNSTLNSGVLNGIQLALTLGINALLAPLFPDGEIPETTNTTDTTDTTT